ncbi:acyltransferase [Rhodococcoides fascians]|uniref:acyltransferase n=1 Tax=Rhodococcoides fascians TaxID=1828 RepID=UPI0035302EEF
MNRAMRRTKSTVGAARNGGRSIALEYIGRLPSRRLRTKLLTAVFGAKIDAGVCIYRWREVRNPEGLQIERGSIIGSDALLDARCGLRIGRNVNLSSEVAIWTLQHDFDSPTFATKGGPVDIGDRAWISFRAIILPGVRIGEGAVVAAGSIVTKDVEPFDVVAGIPAKKIGSRNRELTYEWPLRDVNTAWFL